METATDILPKDSPYRTGIQDVIEWHSKHQDWRVTRSLIHQKYYLNIAGFKIPDPGFSSVVNGLSGIMAILYGEGDFLKTVGIALSGG